MEDNKTDKYKNCFRCGKLCYGYYCKECRSKKGLSVSGRRNEHHKRKRRNETEQEKIQEV